MGLRNISISPPLIAGIKNKVINNSKD